MKVVLNSIMADTSLDAPPKSLFSDIYSRFCSSLDINENWYFGLYYRAERSNKSIWLETSKKDLKKLPAATKNLSFKIRYYPEDVCQELLENITVQIFYLEMKKAITLGDIYCPAHTAALLASYSLQVEFGNYNENRFKRYLMNHHNFLPHRIMRQYKVDPSTWTNSIVEMWKKLAGMDPEDAMMEYLKLVQNLDMYGVTYFNIVNKKKTKLLLGVTALGINIYTRSDKLTPQLSFSWSEIKQLKFKGKNFIIEFMGKKVPSFIFQTTDKKIEIKSLSLGNRDLYIRRRKPDTPEVVILKEKARVLRQLREKNKEMQTLEITNKENFLRDNEEYHHHLQKLQEDLEFTIQKIQQEIAAKLEEMRKVEKAKKEEEESRIQQQMDEREVLKRKAKLIHDARIHRDLKNLFNCENTHLPEIVPVNDKLQEDLKILEDQLENSVEEEEETVFDRIYRNNTREDRDKYRTLSDIRGVNCAGRSKMFDIL
ncbi:moesin/ezrin/radixin homolog 1-like [Harmonia axyridis]|uniref:moesin/ezrin/radixin homolog 1-like n=1 Tax=Harmonia axyridis TaxID=115357 RepID=UPI001E277EFC|nr:moesin/ezrin/radixin homolog 1-like [Harmonia axyridis]